MPLGLTADELLQKARKESEDFRNKDSQIVVQEDQVVQEGQHAEVMQQEHTMSQPLMGNESITNVQGGSIPFTGPLEDLFTCTASPEIEELVFTPSPFSSDSSPAAESLFEISSPTDSSGVLTDNEEPYGPFDRALWEWQALSEFPSVMELVAAAQAAENSKSVDAEELQRWSEIALAA